MVYKVIDDETALLIYEAVQASSNRSFGQYNRMRQLPRTKINGEIIFYLDALMDFATKSLGREPSETLQEVVDAGVISFFANLDPSLQEKFGFSLANGEETVAADKKDEKQIQGDDAQKTIEEMRKTIDGLTRKASSLEQTLEKAHSDHAKALKDRQALAAEKETLRRENASLTKTIDELMDKRAAEEQPLPGPAFLQSDSMGSIYTEMTTHTLTPNNNADKASASKKKVHKKKKRGS